MSDQQGQGPAASTRRRRSASRLSLWSLLGSLIAFALWTWLVVGTDVLHSFDRALRPPRLGDTALEIFRAFAVLTMPALLALACIGMAWWAIGRRLRVLAFTLVLAPVLAWTAQWVLKLVIARPRPSAWYDPTFTERGAAYPSGHVTFATMLAIMVVTVAMVTRRPRRTLQLVRVGAALALALVAIDRWIVGANWVSDVVGGLLLGAASASMAAALTGLVREPVWFTTRPGRSSAAAPGGTCAVIHNPGRIVDVETFRRRVAHELEARGWDEPLWLPTTIEDPGYAMARQAIAARAELVLVAGGDGTVRIVCSELAHSDIPVGIIPAGTANLLCRNLGIPLDEGQALHTALDGQPRPVDLILATIDGDRRHAEHFAVMGGLGIDGRVMADTSVPLKRTMKSVAYMVAIAQNLNTSPMPATVNLDGRLVSDNPATLMLVGNVGEIQTGLSLFPRATAFDGELDLLVTGPTGFRQWFRWGVGVLRRSHDPKVIHEQGTSVDITVSEPVPYQFDGDTLGTARRFEAEIVPGAITIMLPRR